MVRAYGADLRAWAKWYDQTTGGQALTAADPRDIRDYQGTMVRQGLKPATINRRLNAMRRFYKWAVRKGLIDESPFEGLRVGVKAQKQAAPKWLTEKEQRRLLRAVREYGKKDRVRDMAIIRLGLDDVTLNACSGWVQVRYGKGARRGKCLCRWTRARPWPHGWKLVNGIPMPMIRTSFWASEGPCRGRASTAS